MTERININEVSKLLNTGQLDTVVLLVVASQMMRGQLPLNIFS